MSSRRKSELGSKANDVGRKIGRMLLLYVLPGVVLLALGTGWERVPVDNSSEQGAGTLYGEPGPALGVESASAALQARPAPGAALMVSESEGDMPSSGALSAPLTRQVGDEDPEPIFTTGTPALNAAKNEALAVLARDLLQQNGSATHSAGPGYDAPWIRDSFAWGMIPNDAYPQLAPYTGSELLFWLNQQLPSGQWVSNAQSGYYDETAILINAALDAYRVTGNRALLASALPRLRRGWAWLRGNANGHESTYLLWTPEPGPTGPQRLALPIAVDWADQIARRNYPAQVNLLWYRATQSMSIVESVLGNVTEARRYAAFAAGIRSDFNRLLWSNGVVGSRNAAPAAPFGHYRSWYPGERDYFELDTNFQAIVYGVADTARTASILSFVAAHETYLLGDAGGAPPAKTVYGDYEPADYAQVRNKIGDGVYHNAYWPSIGSLAALTYQYAGQGEMVQRVVDGMAAVFGAGQAAGSASEWYDAAGRAGGASSYQWTARSFINTMYHAYLGVDDDWSSMKAENLRVLAPGGEAVGRLRHLGKWLTVHTHGSGRVERVLVDGQTASSPALIPESLLHDGTVIDVYVDGG